MTLTFDLWPWKPFQQWPLTRDDRFCQVSLNRSTTWIRDIASRGTRRQKRNLSPPILLSHSFIHWPAFISFIRLFIRVSIVPALYMSVIFSTRRQHCWWRVLKITDMYNAGTIDTRMNKRMNDMNAGQWMNEWMNKWTSEWVN